MVEGVRNIELRVVLLALVGILGLVLIAFGFAIDGTSEPGHHAGLILGGIAIGAAGTGLARSQ